MVGGQGGRYKESSLKLWTLEEASDEDWVLEQRHSEDRYLTLVKVKIAKSNSNHKVIPYIGQTREQLGF